VPQNGRFWRRILYQVVCWALEAFGQPLAGDGGLRGLEGTDRWQAGEWRPKRAFSEIAGQGADQRGHGVRAGRAADRDDAISSAACGPPCMAALGANRTR
jgi:hypothetical protein